MIKWYEQTTRFGLDYESFVGVYKDFKFTIRYDYDGDFTIKPDCGMIMEIYFMDAEIKFIFGDEDKLKGYAESFINKFIEKYQAPSV